MVSLKILAAIVIGAVAQDECDTHTTGTCMIFGCNADRGPVVCTKDHVCACKEGFCAAPDKNKCVNPFTTPPPCQGDECFAEGARVEVKDDYMTAAIPGTVKQSSPLKVAPLLDFSRLKNDGEVDSTAATCDQSFQWESNDPAPLEYHLGDDVEFQGADGGNWIEGKIGGFKQVSAGNVKPLVTIGNQVLPVAHIRLADYRQVQQDARDARAKAAEELKGELEKATLIAQNAHNEASQSLMIVKALHKQLEEDQEKQSQADAALDQANKVLADAKKEQAARQQDNDSNYNILKAGEDAVKQANAPYQDAWQKANETTATLQRDEKELADDKHQVAVKQAALEQYQKLVAKYQDAYDKSHAAHDPSEPMDYEALQKAKQILNQTESDLKVAQQHQASAEARVERATKENNDALAKAADKKNTLENAKANAKEFEAATDRAKGILDNAKGATGKATEAQKAAQEADDKAHAAAQDMQQKTKSAAQSLGKARNEVSLSSCHVGLSDSI